MENYFNYFTEIEEQFRKCRSEPVLLSPLDWALVESWKEQGFPLEAVLAGIERSFEKFKAGKRSYRKVNTLAYCSQEVFRAVEESRAMAAQGGTPAPRRRRHPPRFRRKRFRVFSRAARGRWKARASRRGKKGSKCWRRNWRRPPPRCKPSARAPRLSPRVTWKRRKGT